MRTAPSPVYLARLRAADEARGTFIREMGLSPCRWSGHNLSCLLRATGERPERVAEMRTILGRLGLINGRWIAACGVFDHGEMWCRDGHPFVIVGHPYGINPEERELLSALARTFPGLSVAVDDRPSYYGFGTHHVRVELRRRHSPYCLPRATRKNRAYARAARAVLGECFDGGPSA